MSGLSNVFNEYQRFTATTAVYPKSFTSTGRAVYLPLGLADEAGELAEKICLYSSRLAPVRKDEIIGEIGDVLWYCARILGEDEQSLGEFVSEVYDGSATLDHIALMICAAAGAVAGRAKKLLRDGAGWDDEELHQKLYKPQYIAIIKVLAGLRTMCRFFGTTLEQVAYNNQVKLTDRKDRGKLNGDGDQR